MEKSEAEKAIEFAVDVLTENPVDSAIRRAVIDMALQRVTIVQAAVREDSPVDMSLLFEIVRCLKVAKGTGSDRDTRWALVQMIQNGD